MVFDFKKEYKDLYLPKGTPSLVEVPVMNFLAVRGEGDPNEEGGTYKQAVGVLYALAYTLKMSYKTDYQIDGYFPYAVPPLEGFWQWPGNGAPDFTDKSAFRWLSVIRLPEFITEKDFAWAVESAQAKRKLDCGAAEFLTIREGLCVQCMHTGPYDDEPETLDRMRAFTRSQGYIEDLTEERWHHEIYLSDPRRGDPAKMKTVLRHPVRREGGA